MVAFMHTGTRLTAGYRYTTLGDATVSEVSRALGHANALTTLRHYVTWFPSGLEAVASRLDAGISEVSGGQGSVSPAPNLPQGGAAGWYPGDCNQLKIEDDQRE